MGFDYHYYVGNNDFLKYFHFSAVHGGQGKKHLFSNCFWFWIWYFTILLNTLLKNYNKYKQIPSPVVSYVFGTFFRYKLSIDTSVFSELLQILSRISYFLFSKIRYFI